MDTKLRRRPQSERTCSLCRDRILQGEVWRTCHCGAHFHTLCGAEFDGCGTLGCAPRPTEGPSSAERRVRWVQRRRRNAILWWAVSYLLLVLYVVSNYGVREQGLTYMGNALVWWLLGGLVGALWLVRRFPTSTPSR